MSCYSKSESDDDQLYIEVARLRAELVQVSKERDQLKRLNESLLRDLNVYPSRHLLNRLLKDTREQLYELQKLHDFIAFEAYHREENNKRAAEERRRTSESFRTHYAND